jgi:hypothetical protein
MTAVSVMRLCLSAALSVFFSCAAVAQSAPQGEIALELNKTETEGNACQFYFVAKNATPTSYSEFKIEFILFAKDGSISRRLVADIGPLKTNRTSVKVFKSVDICDAVDGMLINSVKSCGATEKPNDCHALIKPSSRVGIKLFL